MALEDSANIFDPDIIRTLFNTDREREEREKTKDEELISKFSPAATGFVETVEKGDIDILGGDQEFIAEGEFSGLTEAQAKALQQTSPAQDDQTQEEEDFIQKAVNFFKTQEANAEELPTDDTQQEQEDQPIDSGFELTPEQRSALERDKVFLNIAEELDRQERERIIKQNPELVNDIELPTDFDDTIESLSDRHGVDPALTKAIIKQESDFRPDVKSPAGAVGLMQLMPQIQRAFGVEDPTDPEQNIDGGLQLLNEELQRFGDLPTALAAYNAGSPKVLQAIRKAVDKLNKPRNQITFQDMDRFLPEETRNYVPSVLALRDQIRFSTQERFGLAAGGR